MKILLITGSARPNSTGKTVVNLVAEQLEKYRQVYSEVADLAKAALPFYDNTASPSSDQFKINHQSVQTWSNQVKSADAVIFIMPEYNHSITAIQKNAIDWLYEEWRDKPSAVVAYGYYGGKHAVDAFKAINDTIKTKLTDPIAMLTIGQQLGADGSIINRAAADREVSAVIKALIDQLDE